MPKLSPAPPNRPHRHIMRLKEVTKTVGFGRTSILNKVETGEFPPPSKIGKRAIGWDSDLVYNWMDERLTGSDTA